MSLSLSNKQLDGEFSAGKDLALEITAGESIIWPTGAIEDDPERLILTIQTTEANQVVNLGYTFGQWKGPEYSKTRVNGRVKWESDGKTYRFYGKEGYEETGHNPLVHTYANAGEHQIIIAGKVRWCSCYYYDVEGVLPQEHSIANFLTKIEIGSRATSPIFDFTGRAFSMCKKIATVPSGLLDKCTETQNADGIFYYCDGLTSVPANLFDYCTNITNFRRAFGHCIKLTTVPAHLFDKNTKVTNNGFEILFFQCSLFNSVPEDLFKYNTEVTSFLQTFQNCAITTIPNNLFNTNTKVTSFEGCFESCTKLTTIPNNLFDKCTLATNFKNCFHNCSALKSIPAALFTYNTAVTDFTQTFYNCTQVTGALPTIWDSHKTTATSHSLCFCGCNKATNYNKAVIAGWGCANEGAMTLTIKTTQTNQAVNLGYNLGQFTGTSHGFTNNGQLDWGEGNPVAITENMGTSSSSLKHTYSTAGTHTITITGVVKWDRDDTPQTKTNPTDGIHNFLTTIAIPDGCQSPIYDINGYGFYNCKLLTTIPGGLLNNCTKTTSITGLFEECITLASIPTGLFDKCTALTTIEACFKNCAKVTTIPSGLLSKLTALTNIQALFGGTGLTSIPTGLFTANTGLTNLSYAFEKTKVASLPSGIFDPCTKATTFAHCFGSCTLLTTIVSSLFTKNTAVTTFSYTFDGCTKLGSIPTGLFDANTKVTNVTYCFRNCSAIKSIPSSIFTKNTAITKFDYCFANCTAINTALPTLWTTFTKSGITYTNCFCGCNNAMNYTEAYIAGWACGNTVQSTFKSIPHMVLEIKTTTANQEINLGYTLGRWTKNLSDQNDPDSSITVNGKLDWGDGSAVISFVGTEGTAAGSKLIHTYAKVGTYAITVGGTVTWFQLGNNMAYGDIQTFYTQPEFAKVLTRVLLPTNNSPIVHIANYAFFNCNKLTYVAPQLIYKCTKIYGVNAMFAHCSSLKSIDANFFSKQSLYFAQDCFCASGLTSVPNGIFANSSEMIYMIGCFRECKNLTTITAGIFKGISNWSYKDGKIQAAYQQKAPDGTVKGNPTLDRMFEGSGVTSIPSNFFDYICYFGRLYKTFKNTKIKTIPSKLFSTFVGTSGNQYDGFPGATSYNEAFMNCTSLTTLPASLFPKVRFDTTNLPKLNYSFESTFRGCTALTAIPSTLFNEVVLSTGGSRNDAVFDNMFNGCTSVSGTLPELWTKYTTKVTHANTFTGCGKASNYSTAQSKNWA